jgi:hypothetical protein
MHPSGCQLSSVMGWARLAELVQTLQRKFIRFISDISYIALTLGGDLPLISERFETTFL